MARIRRHRRDTVQSPLETYLREINEMALLTADEEKMLAHRIADGDNSARDRMVRANLRLVVNIARGYVGKGLSLQDLIEEGNLGLLRAVQRFDPARKCRFSTYGTWWIRQAIRRALVNTAKTVRVPSYMVEIIAKWKAVANEFTQKHGRKPDITELAEAMDLGKESLEILKRAINASDNFSRPVSLDVMWPTNEIADGKESSLPDKAVFSQMDTERIDMILKAINPREAEVLRYRYGLYDGQPMTLGDIGKKLRITRERVRQIEKIALRKLNKKMGPNNED